MRYIEFIESRKAQIWYDRRSKLWTCQVISDGNVIQPSRASLTAAIDDAIDQWDKLHTEYKHDVRESHGAQ